MRQLLVTILIFNYSSHPAALWEKYKDFLSKDYLISTIPHKSLPNLDSDLYFLNKALIEIENNLQNNVCLYLYIQEIRVHQLPLIL